MFAELLERDRGTQRALPSDMHGTTTLETINGEQFATVTDLLLFRARTTQRRFSTNKAAFANDVRVIERGNEARASVALRRSRPSIPSLVAHPRVSQQTTSRDPDHTLFVRARKLGTSTTSAAVVATAFAIAILLTTFLS